MGPLLGLRWFRYVWPAFSQLEFFSPDGEFVSQISGNLGACSNVKALPPVQLLALFIGPLCARYSGPSLFLFLWSTLSHFCVGWVIFARIQLAFIHPVL